ncbi:pilus assembly protein PilN [Chromatium okenii]|uniref:PilN domain-containing protein n=1 Tax=Chromatium okenii TaxID=61644 RepID=UPI001905EE2F|nr:pilus assembly protein PilN [Chromatium okenii]
MARINLLPWREAARQQRQQEFLIAGGIALGISLVIALFVHLFIEGQISNQLGLNDYLTAEIAKLDIQIKEIKDLEKTKEDLTSRMEVIQQRQKSRPEIVRLFDELVTALPEGVYLTLLQQTGYSVRLEGRAQSNARVSAFMRKIETSQAIGKPRLLLIENKDKTDTGLSHFSLTFSQITSADEEENKKTKKPAAKAAAK